MTSMAVLEVPINEILRQEDPLDLVKYDEDEYQYVAARILSELKRNSTAATVEKIVRRAFLAEYGHYTEVSEDALQMISDEITDLIRKQSRK